MTSRQRDRLEDTIRILAEQFSLDALRGFDDPNDWARGNARLDAMKALMAKARPQFTLRAVV